MNFRNLAIPSTILVALCVLPTHLLAQDDLDLRYVTAPSIAMTKAPGDRKIGDLYINAPVRVVEKKGSWVHVKVDGWVRGHALSAKQVSGANAGNAGALLEVVDFSIRQVKDGVPKPRVYVSLKLKNHAQFVARSWAGLLVGQSKSGGKVLFREPLTHNEANIAAGKVGEVSFYWEPQELPYRALLGGSPKTLELTLFKVKINE